MTLSVRYLSFFTKFVCAYVLFVIFAGALVTSHDAGLSVPDWPTTYGENMFLFPVYKWVGGIYYEHGHRLVAFGVGSLLTLLAIWVAYVEPRKWVRYLAYFAFGGVIVQGALGGVTVLFGLPDLISVAHGVLAQTLLAVVMIIAYAYSAESKEQESKEKTSGFFSAPYAKGAGLLILVIYLQLIVGAFMRHSGAGLAVLDFPTMAGSWVPSWSDETVARINAERKNLHQFGPVGAHQVMVHLLHRAGAFLVTFVTIGVAWKILKDNALHPKIKSLAKGILCILVVQFTLGVASVLTVRGPFIASFHVVTGAAFLAASVLLFLRVVSLRNSSLA